MKTLGRPAELEMTGCGSLARPANHLGAAAGKRGFGAANMKSKKGEACATPR